MIQTALGIRGGFTAPHRVASKIGADVMDQGGSAIEAMVAAAAAIAVVYPHMNGVGGDSFWIVHRIGHDPIAISACGGAAGLATPQWYAGLGHEVSLPSRGAMAALTVPGTVGGWQAALELVEERRRMPLAELLAPAAALARGGIAVTQDQSATTAQKIAGLRDVPGFAEIYLKGGQPFQPGDVLVQASLGRTLEAIGEQGTGTFYSGDIARTHARFLEAEGSPLRLGDFQAYKPVIGPPLAIDTSHGRLYNTPPPTQGMSALAILAIFDRLQSSRGDGFEHVHGLIEATKQAFIVRNRELGDPLSMRADAMTFLSPERLDAMAAAIDMQSALPWPHEGGKGDTVWMGAADSRGTVVSFIQSVFWEFGSGLTCPQTGVTFQNRGAGFSLSSGPNRLAPGRRPFHTLNPALAILNDGRVMAYGTMGGDGQPQTQAAVFTRHVRYGVPLQEAINRPRWLLGKTWGDDTTSLKIEADFDDRLRAQLAAAGHRIEIVEAQSGLMGHAGAVVRHESGLIEAATDPRSDGLAYAV